MFKAVASQWLLLHHSGRLVLLRTCKRILSGEPTEIRPALFLQLWKAKRWFAAFNLTTCRYFKEVVLRHDSLDCGDILERVMLQQCPKITSQFVHWLSICMFPVYIRHITFKMITNERMVIQYTHIHFIFLSPFHVVHVVDETLHCIYWPNLPEMTWLQLEKC